MALAASQDSFDRVQIPASTRAGKRLATPCSIKRPAAQISDVTPPAIATALSGIFSRLESHKKIPRIRRQNGAREFEKNNAARHTMNARSQITTVQLRRRAALAQRPRASIAPRAIKVPV